MTTQQPENSAKSARGHLLASLNALASNDCAKTSRHLWFAAREAAVFAARQREWPANDDDDIKDAMRKLDTEHDGQMAIYAEFHTAEMFRDNADYGFLDKDEIIWFQPIVHEFVARMLDSYPAEKDERNVDDSGTRR